MADDSWELKESTDFNPCDIPLGMKKYHLKDLTPHQQSKLNIRKRNEIRSDQQYLKEHPEIRGIVTMILRILMKTKPKYDIYEVIGRYFTKPSVDLKQEIYDYIDERKEILSMNSTAAMRVVSEKEISEPEEEAPIKEEAVVSHLKEPQESEEKLSAELVVDKEKRESDMDVGVSSSTRICREVIKDIIDKTFENAEPSLGSIVSVGFPVEYVDHAIASPSSSSSNSYD